MSSSEIPLALQQRVRESAQHCCGYCQSSQKYVMGKLEIEHVIPRCRGGSDEESNLWLSCSLCNRYKGSQLSGIDPLDGSEVELFNPRTQVWEIHFHWSSEGTQVIGNTAVGRATVAALQLNNEVAVEVRRNWVLAGWHPPKK